MLQVAFNSIDEDESWDTIVSSHVVINYIFSTLDVTVVSARGTTLTLSVFVIINQQMRIFFH